MKKSYMTDYLRLNVIYDETAGLQARSFTTPAKYDAISPKKMFGNI